VFYLYDVLGVQVESGMGTVVRRIFVPGHTHTQMMVVGNVMMPQTMTMPNTWSVVVRVGELEDSRSGRGCVAGWLTRLDALPVACTCAAWT
jgi:hypothetical protein